MSNTQNIEPTSRTGAIVRLAVIAARSSGHTIEFYMGAGQQPGLLSQKVQGHMACDMPVNPDGDSAIFSPAFAFIDG